MTAAPTLPKAAYDVLNVVALKKMVTVPDLAGATGRPEDAVTEMLSELTGRELVAVAGGAVLPTDGAEPALKASADEHYAGVRSDPAVADLVDRFETVNAQFLVTMSSWQQIDTGGGHKVANDHSDAAYDEKVIGRLEKLIRRLTPLLDALTGHDPRFAGYPARFAAAMDAIDAGGHELVSSPTRDSVHTIWFEFHEDLLRTLGRERTE
ncbi:hypothetical protein [Pseudonocardia alni]|uniref:hypothetical protein n=1 Tax=Pseudonocardia alni TaxID=33907 RepID=UPI00280B242E|nr:hypothetical protein [Pseudonocardia alni]